MTQAVTSSNTPAELPSQVECAPAKGRPHAQALWLLLAIITALALAVRLYRLTDYGIWFDEAYHLALIRLHTTGEMLFAVLANPPSDPLYVLLLRGWGGIFGAGDASIRAFSVILGTLTVPATFALGSVVAGGAAGLLAALLMALSPYAVEFSQEAALYALAALLTTSALALGITWAKTGRGGPAYVLVAALAFYSHYVAAVILLLFAAGCTISYFRKAGRLECRKFIAGNAIAFFVWLPWLIPMVVSWLTAETTRSALPQHLSPSDVLSAAAQYLAGTAALLSGSVPLRVAGVAAGAVLITIAWIQSQAVERRFARLIVLIAAIVFVAPALAAWATQRWLFVPHFMLFLLPAMSAVAGAGVVWSQAAGRSLQVARAARLLAPATAVVLLTVQVLGLQLFFQQPPHGADGLRELATTLSREAVPGDRVFVTPPALSPSLDHYYAGGTLGLPEDFDLRRIYIPYNPADWQRRSIDRVSAAVKPGDRFWLVYRPERDEGGGLLAQLELRYHLARSTAYEFGSLHLFEVPR